VAGDGGVAACVCETSSDNEAEAAAQPRVNRYFIIAFLRPKTGAG
jgi:hypothetical protein